MISNEGLQPVVQQSTSCPSGSTALQSQTWLRKINARSCVEIYSYQTTRRNFLRRFCEAMSGFAKPLSPQGKLWIVALLVGALQIYFRVKFEDVGSISYLNCMVFYPVLYHSASQTIISLCSAWFNPENMLSLENKLKSLI